MSRMSAFLLAVLVTAASPVAAQNTAAEDSERGPQRGSRAGDSERRALANQIEQRFERGDGQPPVDDVGHAAVAGLGRPLGEGEEIGQGQLASLADRFPAWHPRQRPRALHRRPLVAQPNRG